MATSLFSIVTGNGDFSILCTENKQTNLFIAQYTFLHKKQKQKTHTHT